MVLFQSSLLPFVQKKETEKEIVFTINPPPHEGYYKIQIFARKKPRKRGKLHIPLVATFLLKYKHNHAKVSLSTRNNKTGIGPRGLSGNSAASRPTHSSAHSALPGVSGSSQPSMTGRHTSVTGLQQGSAVSTPNAPLTASGKKAFDFALPKIPSASGSDKAAPLKGGGQSQVGTPPPIDI